MNDDPTREEGESLADFLARRNAYRAEARRARRPQPTASGNRYLDADGKLVSPVAHLAPRRG